MFVFSWLLRPPKNPDEAGVFALDMHLTGKLVYASRTAFENDESTVYKTLHSRDIDDVMNDVTKANLYHHSVEMYLGSH